MKGLSNPVEKNPSSNHESIIREVRFKSGSLDDESSDKTA